MSVLSGCPAGSQIKKNRGDILTVKKTFKLYFGCDYFNLRKSSGHLSYSWINLYLIVTATS